MRRKTCQCPKPVESTRDFKRRLSVILKTDDDGTVPVKKVSKHLVRPKGSQPTPSEVLGGAAMLDQLRKPPKAIAKWLRSLGIKV